MIPLLDPNELRAALLAIPARSIVGVGDNVLDCYLDEDLAYPGGNALNVAAYSRLLFNAESAFIGITGDDRLADHLTRVLADIGVHQTHVRRAHGANGMAFVALDQDGDRRFVGSNRGGVQSELRIRLTDADFEYIAQYSRLHTSVYSAIDSELSRLVDRGVEISYDYSDDAAHEVIQTTAPFVEVGFFSGGDLSDADVDELGAFAVKQGMRRAVVTRGSRGARAFDASSRSSVGIVPIEAVDALGAGDAFITGFLAAQGAAADLDECMAVASQSGALACTFRGAFGYSVHAGDDALSQLTRRYEPA